MDKEPKVTALSHIYSTEEAVPKNLFDELLARYERSLIHLGKVKEENRYIVGMKTKTEHLKKELQGKEKILAQKEQNIAELEMYITVLEEEKKKNQAQKKKMMREKPEKESVIYGKDENFQLLDDNELEALGNIYKAGKNKRD